MRNRRKFQRYNINIPLRVEIQPQVGRSQKIDFEGINVAAGGMLIKKVQSLPESSPVKIEIIFYFEKLKNQENSEDALIMIVTGYVVRNEPEKIAIRFNNDYEMSQSLSFLQ